MNRAQFDILYARTRESGMSHQYITAGWKRSGLYPLNVQKVLERPEIAQYRQTTPELRPPQDLVNLTPQDDWEYREISERLAAKLTRSGRAMQKRLNSAYYEASGACRILSFELATHRKRSLEDEERQVSKRLKKQDDQRIWDTTEVFKSRGHSAEDAELFVNVLPNRNAVSNTGTRPST